MPNDNAQLGMTGAVELQQEHKVRQLAHSELTHEDFLRMKEDGCPVCKAQQRHEVQDDSPMRGVTQ